MIAHTSAPVRGKKASSNVAAAAVGGFALGRTSWPPLAAFSSNASPHLCSGDWAD